MDILLGQEAQEKLIEGIGKAAAIVGSTMGPSGRTVIIPDYEGGLGKYKVTKDGVSVIKSIKLKDPVENIGVKLLQEAADNTVKDAGDGTTTSTVLATAFIKAFNGADPRLINTTFDTHVKEVIEKLKSSSKKLKTKDIRHVATISANNDDAMGVLIQRAFDHSKVVKVETSNFTEDKLQEVDGMLLNVGSLTPRVITDVKKHQTVFKNPLVLVLEDKIESLKHLNIVLNYAISEERPIVIITEYVTPTVVDTIETYFQKGSLNAIVVKAPGFSTHRLNLLKDIATFAGTELLSTTAQIKPTQLGELAEITVNKGNTILTKKDDLVIQDYIDNLKYQLDNEDLDETEKDLLKIRINHLEGTISVIKVGGKSEIEMEERKDRYDDAVLAVSSALEEGIVEGGGLALARIALPHLNIEDGQIELSRKPTPKEVFYLAIMAPFLQIRTNGHLLEFNDETDLFKDNIIDPLKVTRCALENAASVAKTILSTQSVVLNSFEWTN